MIETELTFKEKVDWLINTPGAITLFRVNKLPEVKVLKIQFCFAGNDRECSKEIYNVNNPNTGKFNKLYKDWPIKKFDTVEIMLDLPNYEYDCLQGYNHYHFSKQTNFIKLYSSFIDKRRSDVLSKSIVITYDEMVTNLESEILASMNRSSEERQYRLGKAETISEKRPVIQWVYHRNADVIVEVLIRSEGICERCKKQAPFKKDRDNSPYLEVHHKLQLANGGPDTVENAIALCPNCHRNAHYGLKSF